MGRRRGVDFHAAKPSFDDLGLADLIGSFGIGQSENILVKQDEICGFADLQRTEFAGILVLADTGKASEIGKTKVLRTWFKGQPVYRANGAF